MSSAPAPQRSVQESTAPAAAPISTPQPSTGKVEEVIQGIIREELLRAGITPNVQSIPSAKLQRGDISFLVIAVVDIVLLFWLVPGDFWKDERIAALKDALPLLGGLGGFIAGLYRDPVLKFAQNAAVRIVSIVLAIVLFVICVPFWSFRPVIEPKDAQVTVDTEKEPRSLNQRLWVNLREHSYRLERFENKQKPNTRIFTVRGSALLASMWLNKPPRWALLYRLEVSSPDRPGADLVIERQGSFFDEEFLRGKFLAEDSLIKLGDTKVKLKIPSDLNSYHTNLPVGKYNVSTTVQGCHTDSPTLEIDPIKNDELNFSVEIECEGSNKHGGS